MSAKQAKKIRQLYRRDLRTKLDEDLKNFRRETEQLLKPAPRFIPADIHLWLEWGCPPAQEFQERKIARRLTGNKECV